MSKNSTLAAQRYTILWEIITNDWTYTKIEKYYSWFLVNRDEPKGAPFKKNVEGNVGRWR